MKKWTLIGSIAFALVSQGVTPALAQGIRTEQLDIATTGSLSVIDGTITGDEVVDYAVTLKQSQILSVDLRASNPAAHFNILPAAGEAAIFIGSNAGTVADVAAPADGDYLIRVYLMRNAARRDESTSYSLGVSIGAPEFADGLSGGPDFWSVSGVGGSGVLNLRAGPATRYDVVGSLRNGDRLENRGCRLTGEERWCNIRATGSGVTGWVAGRFLIEAAAPRAAVPVEGGPVGNGQPFDATGRINCAASLDQPLQACPFGVIREGAGNAGVWIAVGGGAEQQILFEGGVPVASSPAGILRVERSGDTTVVRVDDARFEIPDAVVNGG